MNSRYSVFIIAFFLILTIGIYNNACLAQANKKPTENQKSTKFSPGDKAQVKSNLNIRDNPKLKGNIIVTVPKDSIISILDNKDNGVSADGYYWWFVSFGKDKGWCAESWLEKGEMAQLSLPLKAFLLSPINNQGKSYGKAGQIVGYGENKERNGYIIAVDNQAFNNIGAYSIIPYDADFDMSWLYLFVSKNEKPEIMEMKDVAKNILSAFPSHPLYEEIFAVIFLERNGYKYGRLDLLETIASFDELKIEKDEKFEDKYISAICEMYLKKYPNGKYTDIFQWLSFYFTNKAYEIEGSAEVALSQADSFDKYLTEHTKSKVADEIKLKIAESYVIAYECLEYGENKDFPKDKSKESLKKATDIYQGLLGTSDLKIKESAKIALYNIKQNKRIYFNSNGWRQYQ
jgi:hypothetical protein